MVHLGEVQVEDPSIMPPVLPKNQIYHLQSEDMSIQSES